MRRVISSLVLTVAMFSTVPLWAGQTGQAGQAAQDSAYEAFCKLDDVQLKREAFLKASPENRAVLVRTQLERWRDAHRAKLNERQLSSLASLIASITSDTYAEGPKGEEARAKSRPLAEAQVQLFTPEEMQAMQPTGPCIAKVK